ncbi:hypothetical protein [Pseudoclavibacter sp. VKM Ac-2867]|uniref:hypothetical protein n=1 Tax=Pseudoclavibacter sp. VKM Ac-2867 TaxID=2783829 RepID=UPI00188CF8B7|nr:hypothetical protein [Pseudoclavibacter sp. VKM Ac-2867]MBF4457406.1 hypothetical protein [Pseudoclavibacter sp. VKM Ac-2867]
MRTAHIVAVMLTVVALIGAGTATPASAATVISDTGPLTSLTTTTDLSCGATVSGTPDAPLFGLGASCLTAVAAGGTLNVPADFWLSGLAGEEASAHQRGWSPLSQTSTGSGTQVDPFQITTVVHGDLLQLTQVDTYVSGGSSSTTSIEVTSLATERLTPIVYRIADCTRPETGSLAYSEPPTGDGSILCRSVEGIPTGPWGQGTTAGDDYAQLIPLTEGSRFAIDQGRGVGVSMGLQVEFMDSATFAGHARDHVMGLSWMLDLEPGASSTVALQTHYSAQGERAVPVHVNSAPGAPGENTVTATFGAADAPIAMSGAPSIRIPAGASYVQGSSTVGEPTNIGDLLVFTVPVGTTDTSFSFRIRAAAGGVSGAVTLSGSTMGGTDFIRASALVEIAPTASPTPTAAVPGVPIAAPSASASTSTSMGPEADASDSAPDPAVPASTPKANALAATGADGVCGGVGLVAGLLLLALVAGAAQALPKRSRRTS